VTPLAVLGASGAVSCLMNWLARRGPDRLTAPWSRTNHAGDPVSLLEGPSWVLGSAVGLVLDGSGPRRSAAALSIAAGSLGLLDDLAGSTTSKGLRGHLGALREGRVTTGAVKLVGLGVAGLIAARSLDRGHRGPGATLLGGAVIAGTANLVNLLDLRPGRALKAVVALGMPGALSSAPAAAAVGASLGVLRDDLSARTMLGDTGANAAGALLGHALAQRTGTAGRAAALAALVALTLASERVSFSAVIERNGLLRRLDEWGRRRTGAGQAR
jgi:UDP-N-acetylmuramyl pentapeptide phosphotransferase/UDP-N-acetylglucosamine-1-phosphate transferase